MTSPDFQSRALTAEAQVESLKAERDELRKALEPFAKAYDLVPNYYPDAVPMRLDRGAPILTVADLRRARQALAQDREEEKG